MIIQVYLLNGFHGKIDYAHIEFPPSPARLFKALVRGMYKCRDNTRNEEEHKNIRESISYLEKLPLPHIYYGNLSNSLKEVNRPPQRLVPINIKDDKKHYLLELKCRRAVRFPRCYPSCPYLYYEWMDENNFHWERIDSILPYLSYFGDAKSFATFKLLKDLPDRATQLNHIVPDEKGDLSRSVYYEGMLEELDAIYGSDRSIDHSMAKYKKVFQPHKIQSLEKPICLYKEMFIYKMIGDFQPRINQAALVTNGVRSTVLKICDGEGVEPPTLIAKDRSIEHAAYFPLSNVGSEYSNGNIMGVGIALPENKDFEECKRILDRLCNATFGWSDYSWLLEPILSDNIAYTLKPKTWQNSSCEWATITPVEVHNVEKRIKRKEMWQHKMGEQLSNMGERWSDLLDNLSKGTASTYEEYVAYILRNCKQLNLPQVADIRVDGRPYWKGSLFARDFISRNKIKNNTSGHLIHCVIKFSSKVQGPLSLGRGRNFGLGVMKPISV